MRPPIGYPVQWYANASRTALPQAAVVLAHVGDLLVIQTTDAVGNKRLRRDQRHISDPFLARSKEWRDEHGAWDWVPGMMYVNEVATPVLESLVEGDVKGRKAVKV